jgi:hypothetical protein
MFPEFASFSEFPWNCAKLTPRQHYIAHLLLLKSYPTIKGAIMGFAFFINTGRVSKLYDKYRIIINTSIANKNKDKITVKDSNGNFFRVDVTDSRYLSGELISINKNKVCVKDTNNTFYQVSITDARYLSKELVGVNKDKVTVKGKQGKTCQVSINDSNYLSGELKHINTGKVTVKDIEGKTLQVANNDPKYLSGKLTPINRGKVTIRDDTGNTFQVDRNDPRYLSGELVGATKGKTTVRDAQGNTFQVYTTDVRFLSKELVGVAKGRVSEKRSLSLEQVKEIKLAAKEPTTIITLEFISTVVKHSQKDKVGKIPFEELKHANGHRVSYNTLLAIYYADKFSVNRNSITAILVDKAYREIIV